MGPIKLMLQLASQHRDVFEALLSAYSEICASLPRFDRYEKAFKENLEFQHVLAAVYSSILDFHQRAYKFFRRRAWHILFLSLWKDFKNRFDSIILALKKQADFVDREAASIDIVEAKESRNKMQNDMEQMQRRETEILEENERKAKILQIQHSIAWLAVDEKTQESELERISGRRHDKTCEWVINEPQMKAWKEDDAKRPLLWLSGKPGAGKSVMASYVIQTLLSTPDLTCCYYFCNSQTTGNVCHQVLATIVLQLIRQHPHICTLIANNFVYQGANSGMPQLRILVPQLLELVAYTRIVIDGIDESTKENQKALLKELQICTGSTIRGKVLFSSRREMHINQILFKQPQIILDKRQEHVDADITSFVEYKITKLRTSDQELLRKIKSILVEKANGMFLWVRLVIRELKDCYSDKALEQTAESLPKGLEAAYGRILDRIMRTEKSRTMAVRLLGWMACSYRLLKKYEILDGIALDSSNTVLCSKTKIAPDILNLCRPLIEDGPGNTIDFVHFSVKEYILKEEYQANAPFILPENAHLDISFACVAFLNSSWESLLPVHTTDAERAKIVVQGFHSLQVYADGFWHKHLLAYCDLLDQNQRQISTELVEQLGLLLRFTKEAHEWPGPSEGRADKNTSAIPSIEPLNKLPHIKGLVMNVLSFRAQMKRENSTDKTLESISLRSCDIDPTHFSAVRHYYQQAVESLLGDRAIVTYPDLDRESLQNFRDTYGSSAFVCRYLNCVFSTGGFESSSQRAKHESQHRRRYACVFSSCVYSTTGFPTSNLLKRHNEKYHSAIREGPSLADILSNERPAHAFPITAPSQQQHLMHRQQQARMQQQHAMSMSGMSPELIPMQMLRQHQAQAQATEVMSLPQQQALRDRDRQHYQQVPMMQQNQMQLQTQSQSVPSLSFIERLMEVAQDPTTVYEQYIIEQQPANTSTMPSESSQQQQQHQQQKEQDAQIAPYHQQILNSIQHNTPTIQTGWQGGVLIAERFGHISQMISSLRLIGINHQQPPNLAKIVNIGINFEKTTFEESPNKSIYTNRIQSKLHELIMKRDENISVTQREVINQSHAQQAQRMQAEMQMQASQSQQQQKPGGFTPQLHLLQQHMQQQQQQQQANQQSAAQRGAALFQPAQHTLPGSSQAQGQRSSHTAADQFGRDVYTNAPSNYQGQVPKLDRTMSDVFADELYFPAFNVTSQHEEIPESTPFPQDHPSGDRNQFMGHRRTPSEGAEYSYALGDSVELAATQEDPSLAEILSKQQPFNTSPMLSQSQPLSIPNSRERGPPPPLPAPRNLVSSPATDIAWHWGNRGEFGNSPTSVKPATATATIADRMSIDGITHPQVNSSNNIDLGLPSNPNFDGLLDAVDFRDVDDRTGGGAGMELEGSALARFFGLT